MEQRAVYPTEVLQGFTDKSMYVLMLYDPIDNMKVPVMIGEHEAHMIILEQEQQNVHRPMTHQLIASILDEFGLTLKGVRIDRFEEGVFYARLVISDGFNVKEIDARTSDAVVLAMHLSVNITMSKQVIADTGFKDEDEVPPLKTDDVDESIEELERQLRECEENEEYEKADALMKKIKKMKRHE